VPQPTSHPGRRSLRRRKLIIENLKRIRKITKVRIPIRDGALHHNAVHPAHPSRMRMRRGTVPVPRVVRRPLPSTSAASAAAGVGRTGGRRRIETAIAGTLGMVGGGSRNALGGGGALVSRVGGWGDVSRVGGGAPGMRVMVVGVVVSGRGGGGVVGGGVGGEDVVAEEGIAVVVVVVVVRGGGGSGLGFGGCGYPHVGETCNVVVLVSFPGNCLQPNMFLLFAKVAIPRILQMQIPRCRMRLLFRRHTVLRLLLLLLVSSLLIMLRLLMSLLMSLLMMMILLIIILLLLPPLIPLLHRSRQRLLDGHVHPHPPHLPALTVSHPRITIVRGPGLLGHEILDFGIGEFLEVPVGIDLLHEIGEAGGVGTGFGGHDRGGGGVVERVGVVVILTGGDRYVVPSVGGEVWFRLWLI